MEKLLTIEELANMLNVPKVYIYRLNYENRGPKIIRLGNRTIRYRLADVESWLLMQAEEDKAA